MTLHTLTATQLVAQLESGKTSSEEIVCALQARADATEPTLHGFSRQLREEALCAARECDKERAAGQLRGPLHGLPLTVKDNIDLAGTPSTAGLKEDAGHVAERDAVIVEMAKRAGAICLGKSNVPQALLSMGCDNGVYGPSFNPWSPSHVTGGSSSGEGVLVASGASVMGFGTDLGGSIRFPAAFCGVVGFKPTQDYWSNRGVLSGIPGQEFVRAQVGPLARSCGDIALLLQALGPAAQCAKDWRVPPVAPAPVRTKLRVGYFDDDGITPSNPSMKRGLSEALDILSDAGVDVVPCKPWCHEELIALYMSAVSSDGLRTLQARFGAERPSSSIRFMWSIGALPRSLRQGVGGALRLFGEERLARILAETGERRVDELWRMNARREQLRALFERAWMDAELDAVVSPACATPAVPFGMEHDASLIFSYFGVYNILGMPAGVVPVTRVSPNETRIPPGQDRIERRLAAVASRSAGLPVAVQVAAPRWHDTTALKVMHTIEQGARRHSSYPETPVLCWSQG